VENKVENKAVVPVGRLASLADANAERRIILLPRRAGS
jgi:hypothetical protein